MLAEKKGRLGQRRPSGVAPWWEPKRDQSSVSFRDAAPKQRVTPNLPVARYRGARTPLAIPTDSCRKLSRPCLEALGRLLKLATAFFNELPFTSLVPSEACCTTLVSCMAEQMHGPCRTGSCVQARMDN